MSGRQDINCLGFSCFEPGQSLRLRARRTRFFKCHNLRGLNNAWNRVPLKVRFFSDVFLRGSLTGAITV